MIGSLQPGRVADEHDTRRARAVGPAVVHRVERARSGRAGGAEHVGVGQAAEPERVEEPGVAVRPGEPAALGDVVQQVEPRAAVVAREDEVLQVALGAQRHLVGGPGVEPVDEQAAPHGARGGLVQRESELAAHARHPPVGAHHEPGGHGRDQVVELVTQRWRPAGDDVDVAHPAQHRSPGGDGGLGQRLGGLRVADVQHTGDAREQTVQRRGSGFGLPGLHGLVVEHGAGDVTPACCVEQRLLQVQREQLGHAPAGERLGVGRPSRSGADGGTGTATDVDVSIYRGFRAVGGLAWPRAIGEREEWTGAMKELAWDSARATWTS
jgi:hypothetical protein